jgi:hypothetical protein
MKIKVLPPVLALHLKRFKFMEQHQKHVKLMHRVVFPTELRLFNNVRVMIIPLQVCASSPLIFIFHDCRVLTPKALIASSIYLQLWFTLGTPPIMDTM